MNVEGLRIPALDERRWKRCNQSQEPEDDAERRRCLSRATLRAPRDIRLRRLGRLVRDQAHRPLEGEIRPPHCDEDDEPVPEPDQVEDVDKGPHEPADESLQLQPPRSATAEARPIVAMLPRSW